MEWESPNSEFDAFVARTVRHRLGKYMQAQHPQQITAKEQDLLYGKVRHEVVQREREVSKSLHHSSCTCIFSLLSVYRIAAWHVCVQAMDVNLYYIQHVSTFPLAYYCRRERQPFYFAVRGGSSLGSNFR